ncbi:hypothetical protein [Nostoc sp.]|uniref:hypothetical protein n=1 Tax=Nostoc sp. TaxID=1180 RepID=UPI002FFAE877
MGLYPVRLNNLTSSISVLAITMGLIVGQSATQKSLAQTVVNGVGASSVNALFTSLKTVAPGFTLVVVTQVVALLL